MAKLHIVKFGVPVLRERATEIDADSPELQQLIDDMIETMYDAPGVGLAAPQIGVGKRLFVMDPRRDREPDDLRAEAIINPEILEESVDDEEMEEGCLSLPGLDGEVWRPIEIKVRYLNRNFEPVERELIDFPARVFQHEFDHLDGVLFFDHMPLARRQALTAQLAQIKREGEDRLKEILGDDLTDPAAIKFPVAV